MGIMAYLFHFLVEWKGNKLAKVNYPANTALVAHDGHIYKITVTHVGTLDSDEEFEKYTEVLL